MPRGLRKPCQNSHSHSESDLARAASPEGCASDFKIRTAPRRERSDVHKVTRGLREMREHMLDFDKTLRAPRNMNIENACEKNKDDVLPRSPPLFGRGLRYADLPEK